MRYFCCLAVFTAVFITPLRAENILLISIDTLRADHLSCYGYAANKTPAIDRWASEGIRFENAFTPYPLTLPAHSTLFTGTYPFHHGVRENVGFSLSRDQVTIAETLKRAGYVTAGFIGSYVMSSQFGMGQGFETYDEDFGVPFEKVSAATALRRTADKVTDSFLAWLDRHRGDRFFAFVHYYDPHAPCPGGYDRQISIVDRNIGKIDDYLRNSKTLDKTHVILVSDHGESLGEHQESGHGFFLYDCTLHVPMIIRPAASALLPPAIVRQAVSLVDIMPTLLRLVQQEAPAHLQGRSLVGLLSGRDTTEAGQYAETYIPELQFGWAPLRSYRIGRYLFIDAPRPELYDISSDPGQKRNIIEQNAALAAQYRERLRAFVTKYRSQPRQPAAAGAVLEAREKLAALGYVQLNTPKIRDRFGRGIDPKDRITAFESYHALLSQIGSGRVETGILDQIAMLKKMAPEVKSFAFLEAQALEVLGRIPEARQLYLRGLQIEPENNMARAAYANMLLRAGSMSEAGRELELVIANAPEDYRSRNNLAGIYAAQGRPDAALVQLRSALTTHTQYAAGWQNLGQLQLRLRNWKEAEMALRKAVDLDRNNAAANFLLAQALEAQGKKSEAAQHRATAVKLDPDLARRLPGSRP